MLLFGRRGSLYCCPGNDWLYWVLGRWGMLFSVFGLFVYFWDKKVPCECADTYIHVCASGARYQASSVSLCLFALRQVSKWEAYHFSRAGWPVSSQHQPVPVTQCRGYRYNQLFTALYMGAEDSTSGPHTWRASSISNWAMSLAPTHVFLLVLLYNWSNIRLGSGGRRIRSSKPVCTLTCITTPIRHTNTKHINHHSRMAPQSQWDGSAGEDSRWDTTLFNISAELQEQQWRILFRGPKHAPQCSQSSQHHQESH